MHTVLVIGSAGAGKTTLCLNLYDHLTIHRHHPMLINLDPSQKTANAYDYDICTHITTADVMEQSHLGPNSAILCAFDMMADELASEWQDIGDGSRYCVVDMPGQIEIFVHAEAFLKILRFFREKGHCLVVNVFDAMNFRSVDRFLGNCMSMCVARIDMPFMNVVSKCDLFMDGSRNKESDDEKNNENDNENDDRYEEDEEMFVFDQSLLQTPFHRSLYSFLEQNSFFSFRRLSYTEEGMSDLIFLLDSTLQYDENADYTEPRDD